MLGLRDFNVVCNDWLTLRLSLTMTLWLYVCSVSRNLAKGESWVQQIA